MKANPVVLFPVVSGCGYARSIDEQALTKVKYGYEVGSVSDLHSALFFTRGC